jgi:hypothetical protein
MYIHRPFMSLIWLIIVTVPIVFICHYLAKEKGKNVTLWTVLGVIPGVNYFAMLYLIGAANTVLAGKIDKLLSLMQKEQ